MVPRRLRVPPPVLAAPPESGADREALRLRLEDIATGKEPGTAGQVRAIEALLQRASGAPAERDLTALTDEELAEEELRVLRAVDPGVLRRVLEGRS